MNKLIIIASVLSVVLLTGCRTTDWTSYPTYNPTTFQADEQASQLEYINKTLQWQQDQQSRDKFINDSRIKKKNRWWQWW